MGGISGIDTTIHRQNIIQNRTISNIKSKYETIKIMKKDFTQNKEYYFFIIFIIKKY